MNPILIEIGPFTIYWYSLFIFLGFIAASIVAIKEAKRFGISSDDMFNMIFWVFIFGIIGARLYYVIFNWSMYATNFTDVFKIWNGGLAIHGGIIAGLITVIVYCNRKKIKFLRILDIGFVALLLAQAIGRWGNFFNGEAHGAITTLSNLKSLFIPDFLINGMFIEGAYRQPTFLYESLWCLIGFIILMFVRRAKYLKIGQLTSLYLMWYGVGRFVIEAMRSDSLMFGGFKAAQILSAVMFFGGLIWFVILTRKNRFEDLYNEIGE